MPQSENAASAPMRPFTRLSNRRLSPAALYDNWLVAETHATLALAAWFAAPHDAKPQAHALYSAALIREAHAANLLEMRLSPF